MCRGHVISNLDGQGIVETYYKRGLQKINQKDFEIEKVINELDVESWCLFLLV